MGALSDKAKERSSRPRATKPEPSPVRERQIEENKDFARECQNHGADGRGIAGASKRVNDRTYVTTPSGKPETWAEEDQKKQAVAKRRASDSIREVGPSGNEEIIKVAGDSAKETKQIVHRTGVDALWDALFGKPSQQKDRAIEKAIEDNEGDDDEPEFLTRAEQIRREEAANKAERLAQKSMDTSTAEVPAEAIEEASEGFKFFLFF